MINEKDPNKCYDCAYNGSAEKYTPDNFERGGVDNAGKVLTVNENGWIEPKEASGGELTPQALSEVLEGSETVVVDLNEEQDKLQVRLDNDVNTDLARALKTPLTTPTELEVAGVDTTNAQAMFKFDSETMEIVGDTSPYTIKAKASGEKKYIHFIHMYQSNSGQRRNIWDNLVAVSDLGHTFIINNRKNRYTINDLYDNTLVDDLIALDTSNNTTMYWYSIIGTPNFTYLPSGAAEEYANLRKTKWSNYRLVIDKSQKTISLDARYEYLDVKGTSEELASGITITPNIGLKITPDAPTSAYTLALPKTSSAVDTIHFRLDDTVVEL